MGTPNRPSIACSLAPGDYDDRLAWIARLTRDALRGYERHDLVLELRYAPEAADRVREMVRNDSRFERLRTLGEHSIRSAHSSFPASHDLASAIEIDGNDSLTPQPENHRRAS